VDDQIVECENEVDAMEETKKLKKLLFVTSSFGFAVFTMVVIAEIVRLSVH
jgi:hypothetical protein